MFENCEVPEENVLGEVNKVRVPVSPCPRAASLNPDKARLSTRRACMCL